jgi:hypothetical protein
MATTTKKRRKKYIARWEAISTPASRGRGTAIEAWTPPEIHVTWLMVHSMISWPASVAMAR